MLLTFLKHYPHYWKLYSTHYSHNSTSLVSHSKNWRRLGQSTMLPFCFANYSFYCRTSDYLHLLDNKPFGFRQTDLETNKKPTISIIIWSILNTIYFISSLIWWLVGHQLDGWCWHQHQHHNHKHQTSHLITISSFAGINEDIKSYSNDLILGLARSESLDYGQFQMVRVVERILAFQCNYSVLWLTLNTQCIAWNFNNVIKWFNRLCTSIEWNNAHQVPKIWSGWKTWREKER